VINNLTACVYCWFAILAIIGVMKKFGDRTNSFAGWMAEKSWGIYVFHYLPLAMAAYYLQPYVSELPVPMIYLLVGISAFSGALLLNGIISSIAFTMDLTVMRLRRQVLILHIVTMRDSETISTVPTVRHFQVLHHAEQVKHQPMS